MFDPNDYQCENNYVERICEDEVAPHKKEPLLRECIQHYTKGEIPNLSEWEFCQEIIEPERDSDGNMIMQNCLCSQKILHPHIIKYLPTGRTFKIGRHCFENLYTKAQIDALDFFKPICINCEKNKVHSKRSKSGKLGFCSDKCMYIYNKKVRCIECSKKFWQMHSSHLKCKKCYFKSFYGYSGDASYNIR